MDEKDPIPEIERRLEALLFVAQRWNFARNWPGQLDKLDRVRELQLPIDLFAAVELVCYSVWTYTKLHISLDAGPDSVGDNPQADARAGRLQFHAARRSFAARGI